MSLEWGYSHVNGPEKWKEAFPEAAGKRQSPIDIQPINLKQLITNDKLSWKYVPSSKDTVLNTGYCWKVHVGVEGSEIWGGPLNGKYILEQFHAHWGPTNDTGSEHTINGRQYAGELHFVHWNSTKYRTFEEAANKNDGLCVLGVFLKPGKKNAELEKIVTQLRKIEYKDEERSILEPLNPESFIPKETGYYTYQGSLTTPPCSECVIWIVFKEPIEVSQDQLEAFRNLKSYCKQDGCPSNEFMGLVKSNFRPTLPLGQREIHECR